MVEVVDASQRLGVISGGAFDITVQPLWRTYEEHFWSRSDVAPDISRPALDVARTLVDFRRVQAGTKRIALPPGMAITLNGIAQGYITDRIVEPRLRATVVDGDPSDMPQMKPLEAVNSG